LKVVSGLDWTGNPFPCSTNTTTNLIHFITALHVVHDMVLPVYLRTTFEIFEIYTILGRIKEGKLFTLFLIII